MDYARAPLELLLGLAAGEIGGALLVAVTRAPEAESTAVGERPPAKAAAVSPQARGAWLLSVAVVSALALKRAGFSGA
eukprot:9474823-Pyramimonas_sp.AAC.1